MLPEVPALDTFHFIFHKPYRQFGPFLFGCTQFIPSNYEENREKYLSKNDRIYQQHKCMNRYLKKRLYSAFTALL